MFATMKNQKKAQSLINEAKKIVLETDETFAELKEVVEKRAKEVDARRDRLVKEAIPGLARYLERIENEPEVMLKPLSDRPLASQLGVLFERAESVEPARLEAIDRGKSGAFFASVIAIFVVTAAALATAAVGVGLPLELSSFTDPSNLSRMLKWLGGGAFNWPTASAIWGGVGLFAVIVATGRLAAGLALGKASKKNLAAAERSLEEAKRYAKEMEPYVQSARKLENLLAQTADLLETVGVYCDEFNAVLRRILHVEGEDYRKYAPRSKESVKRSAECAQLLSRHLDLALVTTEGRVAKELPMHIQILRRIVSALNKGETFEPIAAGETIDNEPMILPLGQNGAENLSLREEKSGADQSASEVKAD